MPNKPGAVVAVRSEVGDVLLYRIRISGKLGIDLVAAANAKNGLNPAKYPGEKVLGGRKKYTDW